MSRSCETHQRRPQRRFLPHLAATLSLAALPLHGDIESGLIAHYSFENLQGLDGETVVDETGNGHDGICRQDQSNTKVPTIVSGPPDLGDALDFDGSFYVEVPDHADFDVTSSVTLAAWVQVDALDDNWQTMFCRGDWSWRLHRNGSNSTACLHLSGLSGGYGADGTTDIQSPKRWVHLVGTYENGAGAKFYVDGQVDGSSGASGTISTSGSDPVTIGAQIHDGSLRREWKGQIDEVRIYDRALSDTEVGDLYNYVLDGYNQRPVVTTPDDQILDAAPLDFVLSASVRDDGEPLPADPDNPDPEDPNKLRWNWSLVSAPPESSGIVWSGNPASGEAFTFDGAGSPNPPGTIFTCDPTVTLDVAGEYVFEFTASDSSGPEGKVSTQQVTLFARSSLSGDPQLAGYLYLCPIPDASWVSTRADHVLVRLVDVAPADLTNLAGDFISVHGTQSGDHSGTTHLATDGRTIIHRVDGDYSAGEMVQVRLRPQLAPGATGTLDDYDLFFMVEDIMPGTEPPPAAAMVAATPQPSDGTGSSIPLENPPIMNANGDRVPRVLPNGVSVPDDFPSVDVTVNTAPSTDGYIHIENNGYDGSRFTMMLDNDGHPVWWRRGGGRDFKRQPTGMITWTNFNGVDENFENPRSFSATNGYNTDDHELRVWPDGTYMLIGYRNHTVDLGYYFVGGTPESVHSTTIQQFSADDELILQFRAWDGLDIRHRTMNNFSHMNALDLDTDGHILLSSRHINEVTKIDKDSGRIIWQLGGAHSDFTFVDDPLDGFRAQHSIRATGVHPSTGNNRYILFDNGNYHSPQLSRACEYELDLNAMTATLVWEYRDSPDLYTYYMGNVQRLSNGNTLINFVLGSHPKVIEADADENKVFEMFITPNQNVYRAWRCPWNGMLAAPVLDNLVPQVDNVTLIFNKFGDPDVDYYKIYAGTSPNPDTVVAVSQTTLAEIRSIQNNATNYFRVTAVDGQGVESPFSNERSVYVEILQPGDNAVNNGDFADGSTDWSLATENSAVASWSTSSGEAHITVTTPGSAFTDVQLTQAGVPLIQGYKYTLEFDARANGGVGLPVRVEQNATNGINYSGTLNASLTPFPAHFVHKFTMNDPTDFDARIAFLIDPAATDVYIDNVVLRFVYPGDLNEDGRVDHDDVDILTGNWLQTDSGNVADINEDGIVNFKDHAILTDNWTGPDP